MRIYYRAENRKDLVKAISEFTGKKAIYLRLPTYAYQIGDYQVDKQGNLNFDDGIDDKEVRGLLHFLAEKGFSAENDMPDDKLLKGEPETPQNEDYGIVVAMPKDKVNLENLEHLLIAKGPLIKKALGVDSLKVKEEEGKVIFPWFDGTTIAKPYLEFITALCKMSKKQKRISAKTKAVENEKYAFRCFLLRLGFIGPAYKETRKELLKNLSGSSAFKSGERKGKNNETTD